MRRTSRAGTPGSKGPRSSSSPGSPSGTALGPGGSAPFVETPQGILDEVLEQLPAGSVRAGRAGRLGGARAGGIPNYNGWTPWEHRFGLESGRPLASLLGYAETDNPAVSLTVPLATTGGPRSEVWVDLFYGTGRGDSEAEPRGRVPGRPQRIRARAVRVPVDPVGALGNASHVVLNNGGNGASIVSELATVAPGAFPGAVNATVAWLPRNGAGPTEPPVLWVKGDEGPGTAPGRPSRPGRPTRRGGGASSTPMGRMRRRSCSPGDRPRGPRAGLRHGVDLRLRLLHGVAARRFARGLPGPHDRLLRERVSDLVGERREPDGRSRDRQGHRLRGEPLGPPRPAPPDPGAGVAPRAVRGRCSDRVDLPGGGDGGAELGTPGTPGGRASRRRSPRLRSSRSSPNLSRATRRGGRAGPASAPCRSWSTAGRAATRSLPGLRDVTLAVPGLVTATEAGAVGSALVAVPVLVLALFGLPKVRAFVRRPRVRA